MIFHSITIFIIIEKRNKIYILINIKCLIYKTINSRFIKKTDLKYIGILIRKLIGVGGKKGYINKIIKINMDINKYQQDVFFYIIRNHLRYNLILRKP